MEKTDSFKWQSLTPYAGWIVAFILPLPWIFKSREIWTAGGASLATPLHSESFQKLTELLGHHRLILPEFLMNPFLLFLCFVGPLALSLLFLIFYSGFSGSILSRVLASLLVVGVVFSWGAPGGLDPDLFHLILCSAIVLFLSKETTPWMSLGILPVAALMAVQGEIQSLMIAWCIFVFLFVEAFHFIFVDLGIINRRLRSIPWAISLRIASNAILALFALWIILSLPEKTELLPDYHLLWIVLVSSGLAIALGLWRPEGSKIWMRLGGASFLIFLSHEAFAFALLLTYWMSLELLFFFSKSFSKKLEPLKTYQWGLQGSLVTLISLWCLWTAHAFHDQRSLLPEWSKSISLLNQSVTPQEGVLIMGDALPFLSFFVPAKMIENLPVHLESSEESLLELMESEEIKAILVDREFMRRYWAKSIHHGLDPSRINHSLFSRLLLHQGQAIETKTLKIPPIQRFQIRETPLKNIAWVEVKPRP